MAMSPSSWCAVSDAALPWAHERAGGERQGEGKEGGSRCVTHLGTRHYTGTPGRRVGIIQHDVVLDQVRTIRRRRVGCAVGVVEQHVRVPAEGAGPRAADGAVGGLGELSCSAVA